MTSAKLANKAKFSSMQPLTELGLQDGLERSPVSLPEKFADRSGYNPDFLDGWSIPMPKATGFSKKDMLIVNASAASQDKELLNYCHFSIIMSKSRKMAMVTAVNIDGSNSQSIKRANDKWSLDGRIDADKQYGNDLYLNNRLDRGHMVRREDPNWGEDAETANSDTFHYTNSCPQIDMVNQHIWLGLENYFLSNARVDGMKVSVYTGPIFNHNDLEYEYEKGKIALIPGAFWKVIAFLLEDGSPRATAYKISQEKEIGELEFVFGKYKTFQISINQVMEETNLDFSKLLDYDGYSLEELESANPQKVELTDFSNIRV